MNDLLTAIRRQGLSGKSIAEALGQSEDYVSKQLKPKSDPRHRAPTPELIKFLEKHNLSLIDLATSFKAEFQPSQPQAKPKRDYEALFQKWLADLKYRRTSEKTIAGYGESVRPLIKAVDLNTATKTDLQNYISSKLKKQPTDRFGWNEVSANRHIHEIRVFGNWLESNELIAHEENKLGRIELLKEPIRHKPTVVLSTYQEVIKADPDLQHRLAATLAFETGMRKQELANARKADIDWKTRTIKIIGKRNKERHPMFGEASEKLLKEWLPKKKKRPDFIFDMDYSGIGTVFTRLSHKLGKKVNPHAYRRGLTFSLLDQGLDLMDVKEILGHEDIKTTVKYANEYGEKQAQKKYVSPLANIGLPTLKQA